MQTPFEHEPEQHCWFATQVPALPTGFAQVPAQHSRPAAQELPAPGHGPPAATGVGVLVPAAQTPPEQIPEQHCWPTEHEPAVPIG